MDRYGDLRVDWLEYDSKSHVLRYKNQPVNGLSDREIRLVCQFLAEPDHVLEYDRLAHGAGKAALQRAISRIRKQIPDDNVFLVVPGVGYRFRKPRAGAPRTPEHVAPGPESIADEPPTRHAASGWLMAGTDARSHFRRRALGQRSRVRGGDLFRGRKAAVNAVYGWLTRHDSPERALVVTGRPCSGKSALVARVALMLEADGIAPGLAFHAHGATHADFLASLARLVGLGTGANSLDDFIDVVLGRSTTGPYIVLLDALDEAATASDRRRIAETLRELGSLPPLRRCKRSTPGFCDFRSSSLLA